MGDVRVAVSALEVAAVGPRAAEMELSKGETLAVGRIVEERDEGDLKSHSAIVREQVRPTICMITPQLG